MATVPVYQEGQWIDDSRYECVDGVTLRERPMPGYEHSTMQEACTQVLRPIAESLGARVKFEWSLGCGNKRWLTPDVMFALPGFQRASNGHLCPPPPPYLVVEVTSPGQTDLVEKARDYKPYQVPYYWIVDPYRRTCYEVSMDTQYVTAVLKEDELVAGDKIRIQIADLWAAYDSSL